MSETDRILNDILSYLRITAAAASKTIAAKTLDTQEKAAVYSTMDGKTPQQKIASTTGIPRQTIGDWAAVFVEAGLVSPPNKYYEAYRALFTLNELGINIAVLKKRGKSKQPDTAPSSTLDTSIQEPRPESVNQEEQ